MLFTKEFKIVEIIEGAKCSCVIHYLNGPKKAVKMEIEQFKKTSREYEFIGKDGMVVWRR